MTTEYIAHRINTRAELREVPPEYGVEIDLRDYGDRLVLHHDPFTGGEDLDDWLLDYRHGTLILNIKSERIEYRVLELLEKHEVTDYFFLDSSFPMIFQLSECGERNIAVRYSELEPIEYALALKGRATWVWVDCFTRLPLDTGSYRQLKQAGFRLCLVSPELVGRPEDISGYRSMLEDNGMVFDAICTKTAYVREWL